MGLQPNIFQPTRMVLANHLTSLRICSAVRAHLSIVMRPHASHVLVAYRTRAKTKR